MQRQLHPPAVVDHTTDAYLPQVTVRGQLIYCAVALAIVAALGSLSFIRTEVSVQSSGLRAVRSPRPAGGGVGAILQSSRSPLQRRAAQRGRLQPGQE